MILMPSLGKQVQSLFFCTTDGPIHHDFIRLQKISEMFAIFLPTLVPLHWKT